jgi:tellurite methyltransferase
LEAALLLAERGFQVTAVDSSRVAVRSLREAARGRGLEVDARVADLERGGFEVETDAYDLVCDFYYLQRDLFSAVRAGVRPGGLFVASIHTADDDPLLKPMNPAFLLRPGELRAEFSAWEVLLYEETKDSEGARRRRRAARLIARRPL